MNADDIDITLQKYMSYWINFMGAKKKNKQTKTNKQTKHQQKCQDQLVWYRDTWTVT